MIPRAEEEDADDVPDADRKRGGKPRPVRFLALGHHTKKDDEEEQDRCEQELAPECCPDRDSVVVVPRRLRVGDREKRPHVPEDEQGRDYCSRDQVLDHGIEGDLRDDFHA